MNVRAIAQGASERNISVAVAERGPTPAARISPATPAHCRLLGRPGRMRGLQRFLDHVEKHDRVWVSRRIDIARHWTATHPFDPQTAFAWE